MEEFSVIITQLISLSTSTMRLFDSTIKWYSGSASIGPITGEIGRDGYGYRDENIVTRGIKGKGFV